MENHEEIDLKKCEKEKELQTAQQDLSTVEIEDLRLRREVLLLQLKRNDVQKAMTIGKQNVKSLALEVKMLVSQFWRAKG